MERRTERTAEWAHGVVVSHPLRMRKALGSIPSVSNLFCLLVWIVVVHALLRGGGCEHAAACPSTRRQAEDARAQLLRDGARRTTQIMIIVSMTDIVPPWPNGQGVGLLIRRLRVRVPPGVICCYEILEASRRGTRSIAWSRRRSRTRHQTSFARVSDLEPARKRNWSRGRSPSTGRIRSEKGTIVTRKA